MSTVTKRVETALLLLRLPVLPSAEHVWVLIEPVVSDDRITIAPLSYVQCAT